MPTERDLEENEAKLDNLLHKILEAARQVHALRMSLNEHTPAEQARRTLDEIDMLAQTIEELAGHAAILDEQDERITEDLELTIKNSLDDAIMRISQARRTMQ